jgi:GT2 family glycosyltransferase
LPVREEFSQAGHSLPNLSPEELVPQGLETDTGRPIRIGLITVNYKSAHATARLLDDIARQLEGGYILRVVVADNSPQEPAMASARASRAQNGDISFFPLPSNPGYFGAAHQAFLQFFRDDPPDWLIVCNPDIRLTQEDFFRRLAALPPSAGAVIAPRIVSGRTGLDQNPYQRTRPTVLRMSLFRLVPRVWLLHWLLRAQCRVRHRLRRSLKSTSSACTLQPEIIYAPHGSFVIFGREYFQRGGGLNAGSFLYAEETFVAENCRRAGTRVAWVPSLAILHDEHVAIHVSSMTRRFQVEASDYLYKEFFSPAAPVGAKE